MKLLVFAGLAAAASGSAQPAFNNQMLAVKVPTGLASYVPTSSTAASGSAPPAFNNQVLTVKVPTGLASYVSTSSTAATHPAETSMPASAAHPVPTSVSASATHPVVTSVPISATHPVPTSVPISVASRHSTGSSVASVPTNSPESSDEISSKHTTRAVATSTASSASQAATTGTLPTNALVDEPDVDYTFYQVKQVSDISDSDFLAKIKDILVLRDGKYMPDTFWETVFDRVHDVVAEKKNILPERVYQLYLLAGTRMMELLMNAAKADLKDEDMKGKWQDKYQAYVHDYYGGKLSQMCLKNSDWFDCSQTGGKADVCPNDVRTPYKYTFKLKSDAKHQSQFDDFITNTLGLSRDVINMSAVHKYTTFDTVEDPGVFRRQELASPSRAKTGLRLGLPGRPGNNGLAHKMSTEFTMPGIMDGYPPKMGIVLTNFTESASVSLKGMQEKLTSSSLGMADLYQSVLQVIVRTQSGNDTLNQFYQYKDWVEHEKAMEEFLKNFLLELIIGTLIGGIIDFGVGLIGEVVSFAVEAINAAKTVVSIISKVSKAFDAITELPGLQNVLKVASQGIKFSKQFFSKVWDVLPKRVQSLFERLAPKLEKVKDILKETGCDQLSEFVGFQVPSLGGPATPPSNQPPAPATPPSNPPPGPIHILPRVTEKQTKARRSVSSKDDCIFGITSTRQIRGVASPDDYKYCYCYHETKTANPGPSAQIRCPDGRTVQTQYLAPNPLFSLGGYEKTNTLASCDHVWELGELVAFTAVEDKSKAAAMCKRISEVDPGFNSKVRELINGPKNLEVVSSGIDTIKHQIFTGNVSSSVFDDVNRFNALRVYLKDKSQTFTDVKAQLGACFGELEAAEAKAKPSDGQRYFAGVKSKFDSFFDGGMARRADLLNAVGGIFSMPPGNDRNNQISGVDGWLYSGAGNMTTFAGDFLSRTADKAVNVICKKVI